MNSNKQRKRVDIVTIRLSNMELIKEGSFLYESGEQRRLITSPRNAFDLVKDMFIGLDREIVVAAYLNTKNEPIAVSQISVGSLNSSIVHPREVMKAAILSNAASFIVCHNHPSGNPAPSKEDIDITNRLKEVGEIVGIRLMDHIIIGSHDKYRSLKEDLII
ncbi:MAG: JAB domain-containing protein [Tissierellaceae bacterium]|nr:JAB domain-containing protein [Tissierellaceae bacterium]